MTPAQPSLPEHQPAYSPPDSRPTLKTLAEIAQLKSAFEQASSDVKIASRMVSAATPGQEDPNSPEYQIVQRRRATGNEALEAIRIKSEIGVLGVKGVELDKEQEYKQAHADLCRNQGMIPGNDRMILGTLDQQQVGKVQKLDHPVIQYITQRLAQGATAETLRQEAQQRIAEYDRLWTINGILAGLKKGTVPYRSEEYATYIKPWIDKGWTTTQMEAWIKDTIESRDAENLQRAEYLMDLLRLPKIPLEKEQALEQKKALRAQLDTQALASARHELQKQVSADINAIPAHRIERARDLEYLRRPIHKKWQVDLEHEQNPGSAFDAGDAQAVDIVDLAALPPGSLIHFYGSHPGAFYFLKKIDAQTVKAWRGRSREQTGLIGPLDTIATFNNKTDPPDHIGNLYPGFLIANGTQGVASAINMPYFEEDKQGNTISPTTCWGDTIRAIYLKTPAISVHLGGGLAMTPRTLI